jgi:hypothetical protein
MVDPIDLAALIRPDDCVAWSGGPMEPASLRRVVDSQLALHRFFPHRAWRRGHWVDLPPDAFSADGAAAPSEVRSSKEETPCV